MITVQTLSYSVGNIQVVMNGVILDPSDFTATSGTSVVLASGAATGDLLNIYAFKSFTVSDTVSASAGGTFAGNVTVNALLNVDNLRLDGNTISSTDTNGNVTIDPAGTGDTIIASGNVGIGTTTPAGANGIALTVNATTNPRFRLTSDNTGTGSGDGSGIFLNNSDMYISNEESAPMIFRTSATERMRIDAAGRMGFGHTDPSDNTPTNGFQFDVNSDGFYATMGHTTSAGDGYGYLRFAYNGGIIGQIQQNGTTGITYNTSSDYRLKENVTYDWDATTRLKQLKPARFNFIAEADRTVDGFLAHEAQAVVPEAVTGTHNEVDDDGQSCVSGH